MRMMIVPSSVGGGDAGRGHSRALSDWPMVSAHNGSQVEGEAGSRERFALSLKLTR